MKGPTTVRPLTESQHIQQELQITERQYIKQEFKSLIEKINNFENTPKTHNYKGEYTEQRKEQTERFINLSNLIKEYKYYDAISLDNLTELRKNAQEIVNKELSLKESILKEEKDDFLKGKYSYFYESEANAYLSMRSEYLPQSHYDNHKKLDSIHKKIISQREKGEFPKKAISEHAELVNKSYTDLDKYIYKDLDKNSPEYKKLDLLFNEAKKRGHGEKGKSPNEKYEGRPVFFSTQVRANGLPGSGQSSENNELPPGQDAPRIGGHDFLFYGTIAVLTLLAGRYISKQLNAKAQEKPTGETYKRQQTSTKYKEPLKQNYSEVSNLQKAEAEKQDTGETSKAELKMLLMQNMREIEAKQEDSGNEMRKNNFIEKKVKSIEVYLKELVKIDSGYVNEYKEKFLDNTGIKIDTPSKEPSDSKITQIQHQHQP